MQNLLKVNHLTGRPGLYSQQMPRAKETLSKLAVPRVSSQIKSDFGAISGFSKEHPRTCDICRRSETFLNQIVVCSSCKVFDLDSTTVENLMISWWVLTSSFSLP